MPITQVINAIGGIPPSSADPANFDTRADAFVGAFPTLQTQINNFTTQANNLEANVNLREASAVSASDNATAKAAQASESALSAAAFAQQASLLHDVPIIILQPRRITISQAIPNGFNAFTVGPFEVDPDVTVQGLGNATWTGL
jgi:hypothetical protein